MPEKTTLLTRTINDLKAQIPISVIEGDQETVNDAQKIKETGCQVVQINTGTGCHLDAAMVERGYSELNPPPSLDCGDRKCWQSRLSGFI